MSPTTRAFHGLIRTHQRAGLCHPCAMLLAFQRLEKLAEREFTGWRPMHPTCAQAAAQRGLKESSHES